MNFKDFIDSLESEIKHVYLLSGEETFFIDKAREKIMARLEVDTLTELLTFDCDTKPSLGEIINAINAPLFLGKKNVVIVKNAPFFNTELKSSQLEDTLKFLPSTNYVIFTAKDADKRRKLFKIISQVGATLEATSLRPWEVKDWLDEKLKSLGKVMRTGAREYFNERLKILPEISLWYLENELNKVALNVTGSEITAEDLRRHMLAAPEVSNFALTDAVDEKNFEKAIYLLKQQALVSTKLPLVIILLVNHIRQLRRAKLFMKRGMTGRQLGEVLDMNPYIAQKLGDTSKSYREELLEDVFIELAEVDFKLKTGRGGVELLERILFKLCQR